MLTPWDEGYAAAEKNEEENPYDEYSGEWFEWQNGWDACQLDSCYDQLNLLSEKEGN